MLKVRIRKKVANQVTRTEREKRFMDKHRLWKYAFCYSRCFRLTRFDFVDVLKCRQISPKIRERVINSHLACYLALCKFPHSSPILIIVLIKS